MELRSRQRDVKNYVKTMFLTKMRKSKILNFSREIWSKNLINVQLLARYESTQGDVKNCVKTTFLIEMRKSKI
jgi:hypothetical protein